MNFDHDYPTMTTNMSETLLSILHGESWYWDSMGANEIIFNKNGTGKVSLFRVLAL